MFNTNLSSEGTYSQQNNTKIELKLKNKKG